MGPPDTAAATTTLAEEKRNVTRDRILDAARSVFERLGYRHASVAQIVAEAEVSRATFYVYFKGKESAADELARRYRPIMAARVAELPRSEAWDSDSIRVWIRALASEWLAFGTVGAVVMEAVRSSPNLRREYLSSIESLADELSASLLKRDRLSPEASRSTVSILLLATLESFGLLFQGKGEPNPARVEQLTEFWCHVLAVPYTDADRGDGRTPPRSPARGPAAE